MSLYGRDRPEDQIIDLTITLEYSVLAGYEGHEKSRLLAAPRGALLAGFRDSSQTDALLKELYKARNDIAHGGNLLSELDKHPVWFPRQCEQIVRDILREYLLRLTSGSRPSLHALNEMLHLSPRPTRRRNY